MGTTTTAPAQEIPLKVTEEASEDVLHHLCVRRGVVRLVGLEGQADRPVLVTARVDGPDLDRAGDLRVEEVAGVVAAVATTLADLHDLGLVHGAVMASHVLLGPDGRPVLCGFGYGGRSGQTPGAEAPLPAGYVDPARRPGDPMAPSADVYALGALLRDRLAHLPAAGGRQRRGVDRRAADALAVVAGRATTADPALRIGARSLAEAVSLAVPGARLPRRTDVERQRSAAAPEASALEELRRRPPEPPVAARHRPLPRVRRPHLWVAGGVVLASAAVVAGLRHAAMTTPGSAPDTAAPTTVAGPATTVFLAPATVAAAGTTSTRPGPVVPNPAPLRPGCPEASGSLVADTDADGCPELLRWTDGVVEAGQRRWAVGQPGDRVAVADWSCSGRATLALLRPATGDVFVFDGWARSGHDVVAELAGRVEGGFAIRAADPGDGCPRVAVERADGPPVTLAVVAGAPLAQAPTPVGP